MESVHENPLLSWEEFPDFTRIVPEHVEPAMRWVLARSHADLDQLEHAGSSSWHAVLVPLERLLDRVFRPWGVVTHLHRVRDCEELRAAHTLMQPEVVAFSNRVGQSQAIYTALRAIRESADFPMFSHALQRAVTNLLREATLHGVGLGADQRARFNEIVRELAELSTKFGNNVLDSTQAFALMLHQPDDVHGLPDDCRRLAAAMAQRRGHPDATAEHGPWAITLDLPSYLAFMQHSTRRDLRETVYRAYITRASHGEHNNEPLIRRILTLRHEQAHILGFAQYAEMSLARKMAPNLDEVYRVLERLRQAATDPALTELIELGDLARTHGQSEDIQPWDVLYWTERLKEERLGLHDAELRPFFPLPAILDGLFTLAGDLFGIAFVRAQAPIWHPDVSYYELHDEHGQTIAGCYLDLFARPAEKRSGAWMDELTGRSCVCTPAGVASRLPIAYINANQRPPMDGQPALMSFEEMITLFHEFGHALQHMLTTVEHGFVAGISGVEWDAIELASQFMENWCFHRATLERLARHYQTGAPLPPEKIDALLRSRTFRTGSSTLRQVAFALIDVELYTTTEPQHIDPMAVAQRVGRDVLPLAPLPEDRFLCSFSHIFSGGYAAGYYSYKWAEVLSADAFSLFAEASPEQRAVLGQRFRETVLALGGGRHPMEVFRLFQGRDPDATALLRQDGLMPLEDC